MKSFAASVLSLSGTLLAIACLCGCSTNADRFVLLPNPDGTVGAINIRSATDEQLINRAYTGASVSETGGIEQTTDTVASVHARYGALLAAQPPRPLSYTIYILSGSAAGIMSEPYVTMQKLKATLAGWPAPHIRVVGHTDQAGSALLNDEASLRQAQTVTDFLIREGVPANEIETVGLGNAEPAVSTRDGVPHPENRRVVITIE